MEILFQNDYFAIVLIKEMKKWLYWEKLYFFQGYYILQKEKMRWYRMELDWGEIKRIKHKAPRHILSQRLENANEANSV